LDNAVGIIGRWRDFSDKITDPTEDNPHESHLLLTRVWRNGGITSRGQILLFSPAVARVENVLEAATAPSPGTLCEYGGQSPA
jgi:hypothetical protein